MTNAKSIYGIKLSPRGLALFLFAVVIFSWGTMWVVMKVIVTQITPLWAVAIRNGIAAGGLAPILVLTNQFVIPRKGDWPIILVISLFHMTAFATLMSTGLQYVPVGRSIVLGYTTPLWVAPIAWLVLKESMPARRVIGIVIGLLGVLLLFNPATFDWSNADVVIGNCLLLIAALCWSVSIIYTRAHKWISTPFQLVFWQALVSAIVLSVVAGLSEGAPHVAFNPPLVVALAYCSIVGVVIAYWAMTIVNSRVSATTTSLGILATPVLGIIISIITLGESFDPSLIVSTALILTGIAIGVTAETYGKRTPVSAATGSPEKPKTSS